MSDNNININTPEIGPYTQLRPFRFWCQKVLPLVYDESLSYYELLCKVVDYLNKTMEDVDQMITDMGEFQTAYTEFTTETRDAYIAFSREVSQAVEGLENFVNNYFNNLNVQQEINNKLDAMAEAGYFDTLFTTLFTDDIITEAGNVTATWIAANLLQETGYVIDKSLTVENAAADAKATGDAITDINHVIYNGESEYTEFVQGRRETANPETVISSNYFCTISAVFSAKAGDVIEITGNTAGQAFVVASASGFDSGWKSTDSVYTVHEADTFFINIKKEDSSVISPADVALHVKVKDNSSIIAENHNQIEKLNDIVYDGYYNVENFINGRRATTAPDTVISSSYFCTTNKLFHVNKYDKISITNNNNAQKFVLASSAGDNGWITDSEYTYIVPANRDFFINVTNIDDSPIDPNSLDITINIIDCSSRIGKNETKSNNTYNKVYGAQIEMPFELGLVTYREGQPWIYTDGNTMIRTPASELVYLQKGTVVSLTSYTDARFYVGWLKTDGSTKYSDGWKTNDYIVTEEGYYSLLVSNLTPTAQADTTALASLVNIYVTGLDEEITNLQENKNGKINPFILTEKFIAHRGNDNVHAPENTMPAFEYAIESGYKILEYDVRFTSDNVPVIIHDETINRTARNLDGTLITPAIYVANTTYEDLLDYDFGIAMGAEFAGTKIPTVEEFLVYIKKYNCVGDTDLTTLDYDITDEQIEILIDLVRENGMLSSVMFTSNGTIIRKLLQICPGAMTWIANQNASTVEACAEIMKAASLAGVSLQYPYASKSWFEAAHNVGLMSKSFTPYTNTQINEALDNTPDMMIVGSLGKDEIAIA